MLPTLADSVANTALPFARQQRQQVLHQQGGPERVDRKHLGHGDGIQLRPALFGWVGRVQRAGGIDDQSQRPTRVLAMLADVRSRLRQAGLILQIQRGHTAARQGQHLALRQGYLQGLYQRVANAARGADDDNQTFRRKRVECHRGMR